MFQKFLGGHGPNFSPSGRWRVTRISGGETLKISKWVSHHEFSRSRDFQNYLQFLNQISKNQDSMIWRFWSTTKLEVEGSQPVRTKISKFVFFMCFLWLIELWTSDKIKFGRVELILSAFEGPPSVGDQGRWRVTRG